MHRNVKRMLHVSQYIILYLFKTDRQKHYIVSSLYYVVCLKWIIFTGIWYKYFI